MISVHEFVHVKRYAWRVIVLINRLHCDDYDHPILCMRGKKRATTWVRVVVGKISDLAFLHGELDPLV